MDPSLSQQPGNGLNRILSVILLAGVMLAVGVVLLGAAVFLLRHGNEAFGYRVFQGEPVELRTLSGIFASAFDFSGRGLIQLGLLLLVATPVVRVVFTVLAFAARKDLRYVVIGLVVLANLILGLSGVLG